MKDLVNPNMDTTKEKILEAAEAVFAEKGFDGARVSEIGKRAGVNPALLYYYYGSKNDILHELMVLAIEEAKIAVENGFENFIRSGESMAEFLNPITDYLMKKKSVIRIMLIEILKHGNEDLSFFKLLSTVYNKLGSEFEKTNNPILKSKFFMTDMFFVFTSPIVMHIVLGEKWGEFDGISEDEARKRILSALEILASKFFFGK
jgi:AcrR family transcriptional regulator